MGLLDLFSTIGQVLGAASEVVNTVSEVTGSGRRTDEEAASEEVNWHSNNATYSDCHGPESLKRASCATNIPGVYIIRLNGRVMKVGSAEIGVRKRMQQYYGLNSYCGLREITEENRDEIEVEWQDCPRSKCNELESKLARKYGKGPWAERTPHCSNDTWKLLI